MNSPKNDKKTAQFSTGVFIEFVEMKKRLCYTFFREVISMRKRMKSENKNKGLIPGVKMILVCAVLFISLSAAGIFSYIKYKTDETSHHIPSVSSVRFENGRVLELTWSFGKYKKVQAGDYNYRLQFYDENRQLRMELNVGKISDTTVALNSVDIGDMTMIQ